MSEPSTALERAPEPTSVELADRARSKRAVALSKAHGLLPKALHDKPNEIFLILVKAEGLGIPDGEALANLYPIEGRLVPSAQLQAALIRRAGHELQVVELSRDRCVVRARRRGNTDWLTVDYTIDDARDSGLVDQWVEQWTNNRPTRFVVGDDTGIWTDEERKQRNLPVLPDWAKKAVQDGQIKRKDNWWKYRRDMLRARCITFIGRSEFSDCLLGIGGEFDWTADDVERAETRAVAQERKEDEPEIPEDEEEEIEELVPVEDEPTSDTVEEPEAVFVCDLEGCDIAEPHDHDRSVRNRSAKQPTLDDEPEYAPGEEPY